MTTYLNPPQGNKLRLLAMTKYPLSSLPRYRSCTNYIFGNLTGCPEYPCLHTPCHDPDWLEDLEDLLTDSQAHLKMRRSFRSVDGQQSLSDEEWSLYGRKFERCRRLQEKRSEINATLAAHAKWVGQQRSVYWENEYNNLPEALKKVLEEKWEIEREVGVELVKEVQRVKDLRREQRMRGESI